jgi:hypothetical protein
LPWASGGGGGHIDEPTHGGVVVGVVRVVEAAMELLGVVGDIAVDALAGPAPAPVVGDPHAVTAVAAIVMATATMNAPVLVNGTRRQP